MNKHKLHVVTSFVPKGGVGKTAILEGLGWYLSYLPNMNVGFVDTDSKGSLIEDYGAHGHFDRFDISDTERLRALVEKHGFYKTNKEEERSSVKILHYPTEMFAIHDVSNVQRSNDEWLAHALPEKQRTQARVEAYKDAVFKELAKDDLMLLLDGRPPTMDSSTVLPMTCLDDHVASYTLLVITRVLQKEIDQGFHTAEMAKYLMMQQGVRSDKIKIVHVVNFAPLVNIYAQEQQDILQEEREELRKLIPVAIENSVVELEQTLRRTIDEPVVSFEEVNAYRSLNLVNGKYYPRGIMCQQTTLLEALSTTDRESLVNGLDTNNSMAVIETLERLCDYTYASMNNDDYTPMENKYIHHLIYSRLVIETIERLKEAYDLHVSGMVEDARTKAPMVAKLYDALELFACYRKLEDDIKPIKREDPKRYHEFGIGEREIGNISDAITFPTVFSDAEMGSHEYASIVFRLGIDLPGDHMKRVPNFLNSWLLEKCGESPAELLARAKLNIINYIQFGIRNKKGNLFDDHSARDKMELLHYFYGMKQIVQKVLS